MKLDEIIVSLMVLISIGSAMPFPAESEVSTTDIAVPNDVQIAGPINPRPTANSSVLHTPAGNEPNQAESGFQLANALFPHHFGEFFEVFEFFMERRWHREIEETIEKVAEKIISEGGADRSEEEIQMKNDHLNIPFKLY